LPPPEVVDALEDEHAANPIPARVATVTDAAARRQKIRVAGKSMRPMGHPFVDADPVMSIDPVEITEQIGNAEIDKSGRGSNG
jgi:hypothetical protein